MLQYKHLNVPSHYRFEGRSATEIAASIESAVRDARLGPGSRLPTVRELAARLRVSPTTVAAAFQQLRRRGLVSGQGRRGTRVTHRPPLPTASPGAAPSGLRNLADGNPDPALLPRLPAPARPRRPRLYGEGNELPELLALARRSLAADGIRGEPAVVSGGLDGIERALLAHLAPGDRVAVEDPGFTGVFDLLAALGLVAEPVGIDDFGLLPGELARVLDTGARAVVVTPRAQNPTGAAIDERRARELASVLERHPSVLVIEDDHAGPVAGAPVVTLSGRTERWAVVRSVSKSLGPDLRLGIVAADEATVARIQGRQRLGMGWVSHILQRTVLALWSDRRVTSSFAAARKAYAERRAALLDRLRERGVAAHGRSGLNVWIPMAEEAAALAALAERGWAVRAGEPYRIKAPAAIRVTISTLAPRDAEKLADDVAAVVRPTRPSAPLR